MDRRAFFTTATVGGLMVAVAGPPAAAQGRPRLTRWSRLLEPGDLTLGQDTAPTILVEYASLTCGHCANFHRTITPQIRRGHVDRGQTLFVYRDFPLDALAMAGAMVIRHGAPSPMVRYQRVGAFFDQQADLVAAAQSGRALDALIAFAAGIGVSEAGVRETLANRALMDEIRAVGVRGAASGVTGTPSLFVNGRLLRAPSGYTYPDIASALAAAAGAGTP